MWPWLVAGAVLTMMLVRQVCRLVELMAARRAKQRLARLFELVTAWQAANHDEVAVLNQRIVQAHRSMTAAENAARASSVHLTRVEHLRP